MKAKITYTKRYYKSTTKEVDVPDDVPSDEVEDWALENALELFEDEVTAADLNYEDDEVFIVERN